MWQLLLLQARFEQNIEFHNNGSSQSVKMISIYLSIAIFIIISDENN